MKIKLGVDKLSSYNSWMNVMILFLTLVFIVGCAPLPSLEIEEEVITDSAPKLSKAEMDDLAARYRSFAHEYWKQKDYETASSYYDSVLTYDYDHKYNVYRALADCCINLKDNSGAVKNYETGIKYFPDDAYLHSSLAYMYKNMNRIEDAIFQQKEAIRIKPEEVNYKHTLAEMYIKAEDFDGAINTYQELVEMFPDDASLNEKLTNLIVQFRDPEEVLQMLKDGVEQFPADAARRLKYANALFDQGLNQLAADEFGKYTTQMPADVRGWNGLARSNDNLGKFKSAIAAYKRVAELEPKNTDAMVAIGQDYLSLKSWKSVRVWAKRALAADVNAGSAWIILADAYQSSADIGSGDSPDYYDKLVFLIAYGLYKNASSSADIDAASDGDRGMRYLKASELIPAKEDRFMNKNKVRPIGDDYKWIDNNWTEIKYIDKFLKSLDG